MKNVILPLFLLMLFACIGNILYSQNHCCSKSTLQCRDAATAADCVKTGQETGIAWDFGPGPCVVNRCARCCSLGMPYGQGCLDYQLPSDCEALGGGAYALLPVSALTTCTKCIDNKGRCCLYTNLVYVDVIEGISIIECGARMLPNDRFWRKINEECPQSILRSPDPNIISKLDFLEYRYNDANNNVQISWKVNPQAAYFGFYIERSRDGINFKRIGFADANSSPQPGVYEFADINPLNVGYYRVLSVHANGGMATSQVLNIIALKKDVMLIMPNPAINRMSVLIGNMQLYNTQVSVSDLWGREVLKQTLTKGEHSIDVHTLPPGSYAVRAWQNGNVFTGRFVKN